MSICKTTIRLSLTEKAHARPREKGRNALGRISGRQINRPRARLAAVQRAGAVVLGCMLALSTLAEAEADEHGNVAESPSPPAAAASSAGTTGMSADSMGAMLRADMAPPAGITGGMSPKRGVFMPQLRHMHMRMQGMRNGTDDLSAAEVLADFPVTPRAMDVDMLMLGAMYGVTDDISVMAMIPYLWKSMDHLTRMDQRSTLWGLSF